MKAELGQQAKNGRVSIFLDGLDEVSATEFFNNLRHLVREFLADSDYKHVPLFISTRPYALKDRFSQDEAEEMEIEAFTQEEIDRFVTHYYPDDPQAHRLLMELRARPELRDLARVPALLGFLLLLYRKQQTAPENRIDLYNEVLHQLVSQWDHEKGVERAFKTTDIRRRDFLSHLAFARLIVGQKPTLSSSLVFSGSEILDEAERYCQSKQIPNQADLLAEDVKGTALLSQVGTDSYAFAHLTIQEFLAATTLAKDKDCPKHFCRAYFDPILSELEVLPMTLVMGDRAEELFSLLTELAESVDFKRLRLKARSLRYGSVPETVLTGLAELLKQMVTSEEVEFGYFAAVVKSFRGASIHAAKVIAAGVAGELSNEAEVYRSFAVRVLGFLENEAATQLIEAALQDTDRSVRVEAALFISLNNNGAAVDNLVAELRSEDSDVKEKAIYALWQIGTEKAIQGLKIAIQDTDKFVRGLALEALSNLTDTEAIPILIAYRTDPDPWVRKRIVSELGDIGGENVVDALIGAAQDSDTYVAQEALRWLGQSTVERVFDFLLDFLEKDAGILTGDAAEALGRIGNATAINRLYALLETYKIDDSERDPLSYISGGWIKDYVRVRAARALVRLGDERGKSVLLELLSEGDIGERKYAAYALKDLGGIDVQSLLTTRFSDAQDEEEQITLANCLLDLGASDQALIVNRMTSILNSHRGSRSHVIGAINVLGRLTGNGTVQALTKALAESSDVFVQIAAMTALGNVGTESELAVEQLLVGLIGVNAVSQTSARVLAKMSYVALARGLHLCLKSDWKYVRRKAGQTIAYYTSDASIEHTLSALVDTDPAPRVKEVAYEALSQINRRRWAV